MPRPRPYGIGPYGVGPYDRAIPIHWEAGGATGISFVVQGRLQQVLNVGGTTSISFAVDGELVKNWLAYDPCVPATWQLVPWDRAA